jgi:hypothetical protein
MSSGTSCLVHCITGSYCKLQQDTVQTTHTYLKTSCPPVDYRGVQNCYKTHGLSSAILVTVLFLSLLCLLKQKWCVCVVLCVGKITVAFKLFCVLEHDNAVLVLDLPYLLECKRRFFPEIWRLIMWGHLKFAYKALNWTAPNWITLNQTMQSQTKSCIAMLSMRYYKCCLHFPYYSHHSCPRLINTSGCFQRCEFVEVWSHSLTYISYWS